MIQIRLLILAYLIVGLTFSVQANMMKCTISGGTLSYFSEGDSKQREKCVTTPKLVTTTNGEEIQKDYQNSGTGYRVKSTSLMAAKNIKPSCGGSGGTVKVNGRVFHLDQAALCRKYGGKGTGKITAGKAKFSPRLYKVDGKFRKKIATHVQKMSKKYKMEAEFIHAIISAESAYNPNAKSHAGAQGLMQLMPFTAKRFGVSNPYDPFQNVEAGTKYLKILYDEFGTLELAAAGYNAGEGSVRKYNQSIPPYKETMKYVPKVMAFYRKYKKNHNLITAN